MAADDDVKYRTEDASNNNVTAKQPLLFPKKAEVDLSFKNLTYTVNTFNKFKRVKKEILHGVTGNFRSGQLTAIMGPSGCGKSTLLNVLAGYSTSGSSGSVYLNGTVRDEAQMSNISCYIQQDDFVRDRLTVRESMTVAANLKLPTNASFLTKVRLVEDLLNALGLSIHGNTVTKRLSGGQKKRLSIALELISNPSILFLDEPTTGLDSQSCSQFVSLMVNLAHNENRTMVCTLHQPSALLFEKFDQVYVLTAGRCIYQGPPNLVIPYFANLSIVCPPYHNPADFLIEVAIGDYGVDALSKLPDSTTTVYDGYTNINLDNSSSPDNKESQLNNVGTFQKNNNTTNDKLPFKIKLINKPPSYLQVYHLYLRNVIMYKRNKTTLMLRIIAHLAISLIFGYLYRGVGNDASTMFSNTVFIYGSNLFLVYTGQMAVIVAFPLEYKVLKREHFNNWFSLFPYMISTLLVEIPFQILCCVIYIVPSYVLTNQPLELMRFSYFTLFLVVTSLTSQSTGFLCGATLPVKVSVFIGPVFVVLLSVFGFAIRLTDIPSPYVWLHYFSFVRASLQSIVYSIYGFSRDDLPCYEHYCHYKNPVKYLNEMEFAQVNIYPEFFFICFFFLCTYLLTTTVIWYRLNKR